MTRLIFLVTMTLFSFTAQADQAEPFNKFFATQWGPTPFNSAGHPDGYDDCGPTSLLMAAADLGLMAAPTADTAESEIRQMRNLTRGQVTAVSGATYGPMMIRGAQTLNLKTQQITPTAASVLSALQSGALVLMAGDPRTSWGFSLDKNGSYLHHYGAPGVIPPPANGLPDADHFGHWVIAFGVSPDGKFYVGDPLSTSGVIAVTAEAIDQYFAEWPLMTGAIALSK